MLSKNEDHIAAITIISGLVTLFGLKITNTNIISKNYFLTWSFLFLISFSVIIFVNNFILFGILYIIFNLSVAKLSLYIRMERAKNCSPQNLGKLTGYMIFFNSCSMPISGYLIYIAGKDYLNTIWITVSIILGISIFISSLLIVKGKNINTIRNAVSNSSK